jgi:hypothetical protein
MLPKNQIFTLLFFCFSVSMSVAQTVKTNQQKTQWSLQMNALSWGGVFAGPELRIHAQLPRKTFLTGGFKYSFYEPFLSSYDPTALSDVHLTLQNGFDFSLGIGNTHHRKKKIYHHFQLHYGKYDFDARQRYCQDSRLVSSSMFNNICICEKVNDHKFPISTTRMGISYEYGMMLYEKHPIRITGAFQVGLVGNQTNIDDYRPHVVCEELTSSLQNYSNHKLTYSPIEAIILRQGLGGVNPSRSAWILIPTFRPLLVISYQL